MDLAQYVDRLPAPLESAVRLTVLAALSSAASEITRELAPGSVDVRLRGLDPEFVVTPAPASTSREEVEDEDLASPPPRPPAGLGDAEDGGTVRMTVRLPEQLKLRIEEAAGGEALPVNTWIVRTLAAALEPSAPGRRPRRHDLSADQRSYTGWVQ